MTVRCALSAVPGPVFRVLNEQATQTPLGASANVVVVDDAGAVSRTTQRTETIVGGSPWWTHRRRRAKVRVERTLAAWPHITAAIGLPGSRVRPARTDQYLTDGVDPGGVQRWVRTASLLHSNGDAMDIAVANGRIVGVRGRVGCQKST
jgi:hypothetical protein